MGLLNSTSTDTLKYLGKPVSPNEVKPGDIVFFDTYKPDGAEKSRNSTTFFHNSNSYN